MRHDHDGPKKPPATAADWNRANAAKADKPSSDASKSNAANVASISSSRTRDQKQHDKDCRAAFEVWYEGVYPDDGWFADCESDLYAAWVRLHESAPGGVKYSEISQAFDTVVETVKRQYGE